MRYAKREDVLRFLIPGFLVLCSALAISVWEFSTMRGSTLVLVPQGIAESLLICGLTINLVATSTNTDGQPIAGA